MKHTYADNTTNTVYLDIPKHIAPPQTLELEAAGQGRITLHHTGLTPEPTPEPTPPTAKGRRKTSK
jgi:hypothetical protein